MEGAAAEEEEQEEDDLGAKAHKRSRVKTTEIQTLTRKYHVKCSSSTKELEVREMA